VRHTFVLATVAQRKGALVLAIGGWREHVHIYISLPSHTSIAAIVDALKANSSRWVHETSPHLRIFASQKGYSAFSVCKQCEPRLIRYIRNQEARHGPSRHAPTCKGGDNESPP